MINVFRSMTKINGSGSTGIIFQAGLFWDNQIGGLYHDFQSFFAQNFDILQSFSK